MECMSLLGMVVMAGMRGSEAMVLAEVAQVVKAEGVVAQAVVAPLMARLAAMGLVHRNGCSSRFLCTQIRTWMRTAWQSNHYACSLVECSMRLIDHRESTL